MISWHVSLSYVQNFRACRMFRTSKFIIVIAVGNCGYVQNSRLGCKYRSSSYSNGNTAYVTARGRMGPPHIGIGLQLGPCLWHGGISLEWLQLSTAGDALNNRPTGTQSPFNVHPAAQYAVCYLWVIYYSWIVDASACYHFTLFTQLGPEARNRMLLISYGNPVVGAPCVHESATTDSSALADNISVRRLFINCKNLCLFRWGLLRGAHNSSTAK